MSRNYAGRRPVDARASVGDAQILHGSPAVSGDLGVAERTGHLLERLALKEKSGAPLPYV